MKGGEREEVTQNRTEKKRTSILHVINGKNGSLQVKSENKKKKERGSKTSAKEI